MNAPLALPRATAVLRATPADDRVVLDYEGRFLRRKRLISVTGVSFLVDLAETVSLDPGDALRLELAVKSRPRTHKVQFLLAGELASC